jgi:hypothetical protein
MIAKSRNVFAASLLLLSSLTAGQAYAQKVDDPTQYEYEQLQKSIIIGKTTKEEIRAKFGDPDYVHRASARQGGYEQSWSYYPSESHGEKVRSRVTGFFKNMIPGRAGTAANVAEDTWRRGPECEGFLLVHQFRPKRRRGRLRPERIQQFSSPLNDRYSPLSTAPESRSSASENKKAPRCGAFFAVG